MRVSVSLLIILREAPHEACATQESRAIYIDISAESITSPVCLNELPQMYGMVKSDQNPSIHLFIIHCYG